MFQSEHSSNMFQSEHYAGSRAPEASLYAAPTPDASIPQQVYNLKSVPHAHPISMSD